MPPSPSPSRHIAAAAVTPLVVVAHGDRKFLVK
jgi:hypothetical protein